MNRRLIFYIVTFTIFVSALFVIYNPDIATPIENTVADHETFMPENGHFDFREFSINSTSTKNFTSKTLTKGHYQLIDDEGNITINVLNLDKMFNYRKDKTVSFLKGELKKPTFAVDGVEVHEIEFRNGAMLYAAYFRNSTTNTIICISTPNEKQTADLMNSLEFNPSPEEIA